MPHKAHFRGLIIGLGEPTIALKMEKLIMMRMLKKIGLVVNIRGAYVKSGLSHRNYPPCELPFTDVEVRPSGIECGNYRVNS